MLRVQFGSGHNQLEGWDNRDSETPIEKPLPFETASVDEVLAEHVIEHVPFHCGMGFLRECHRILKPMGELRVSFPSVEKVFESTEAERRRYLAELGFPAGEHPVEQACKLIMMGWGHVATWTAITMTAAMRASGFHLVGAAPRKEPYDRIARELWARDFENVAVVAIK